MIRSSGFVILSELLGEEESQRYQGVYRGIIRKSCFHHDVSIEYAAFFTGVQNDIDVKNSKFKIQNSKFKISNQINESLKQKKFPEIFSGNFCILKLETF